MKEEKEITEVINRITSLISSSKGFEALQQSLSVLVDAIVDVDYSGLYLIDEESGEFRCLFAKGFTEEEVLVAEKTAMSRHPGKVFKSGEVFHCKDTFEEKEDVNTIPTRRGVIRSRLYIPIVLNDKRVGAFGFASESPGAFSTSHISALEFLGNFAAIQFENIAFRAKQEQSNEELERLVEKRSQELAKKDAELALSSKLTALGTLSAGVAHELNNPLQGVVGFADSLRRSGNLCAEDLEDIDRIIRSADRMKEIVKRLNSIGGSVVGNDQITVDILDSVSSALEVFECSILENKVEISVNVKDSLLVKANRGELEGIIRNLIKNAIDSLRDKEVGRRTVSVTAKKKNDNVELTVEDSGCGMSAEGLERMFEPFYTTKEVGEGTGLGLSIARTFTKNMRGKLGCESVLGEGTRFILELPLCEEGASDDLDRNRNVIKLGQSKKRSRLNILIVDDDPDALSSLEIFLGNDNNLTSTRSSLEAVRLLGTNNFDLVVSDLEMPHIHGRVLVEKVKGMEGKVPIIVVTGFGPNHAEVKRVLKLGVDGLVLKPFNEDDLRSVVNEVAWMAFEEEEGELSSQNSDSII